MIVGMKVVELWPAFRMELLPTRDRHVQWLMTNPLELRPLPLQSTAEHEQSLRNADACLS